MLVIDASAVVELLTTDPSDVPALARRIHDAEWMNAPGLIDYEVLNVLRKMVGRGDIDAELAESSRLALQRLRLIRHSMSDAMAERIWQLRHNVSAYDASYLALAEHLGMALVTTERRLATAAQSLTDVRIESYVQPS